MDLIKPDEDWRVALFTGPTIELKVLADAPEDGADAGSIEGYASTFGEVDGHRDLMMPGAFADSLSAHTKAGTAPALLWSHRQAEPIGKLTGVGEDDRGLRFRGKLNLKTAAGRKAYEHGKAGDVTGASIGFRPAPGGAVLKGGVRHLHKVNLHEISIVATPADPRARQHPLLNALPIEAVSGTARAGAVRATLAALAGEIETARALDAARRRDPPPGDPRLRGLVVRRLRGELDARRAASAAAFAAARDGRPVAHPPRMPVYRPARNALRNALRAFAASVLVGFLFVGPAILSGG